MLGFLFCQKSTGTSLNYQIQPVSLHRKISKG
nr:MAG TPA: hypothetical protein [Caudoviricetes sp.]DAM42257.1 MAG TPA: hypothetical protein [Caudoviricetes sp.]